MGLVGSHHILIHPTCNVIIHRLYEIVNVLLPAIISEREGIPKWHEWRKRRKVRARIKVTRGRRRRENLFRRPIDKKRKSNSSHVPRDHSCSKRRKICTSLFPIYISYLRIVSRCWTRPTKNRKIPSVPAIDSYLQLLRLIASILTRLVRFSLNYTLDSLLNKLFDEGFNVART